MASAKALAIIAGAGPGTGASVAARFAKAYTVVLLARTPGNLSDLVDKIASAGGEAIAIPTDVTNQESVQKAFATIKRMYPEREVRVGVYNVGGQIRRMPFLELKAEDWHAGAEAPNRGAFNFSQGILPLLVSSTKTTNTNATSPAEIRYPPTLIFTGATASVKASALLANFSPGKFALRSLSQSLAKEFAPQGVHVGHAVIDGIIDLEKSKGLLKNAGPDSKMSPEGIAEAYWHLHSQVKSVWTWEIDLRPWVEKW